MDTKDLLTSRMLSVAKEAYQNMIRNYWSEEKGYFIDPFKEYGRDTLKDIMWCYAQLMLCLESYYLITGDNSAVEYIDREMKVFYDNHDDEWLLTTGDNNNPCMDDAAWSSMAFALHYRLTGCEKSLDMCHRMIKRSYDHWQNNGSTRNGLWYKTPGSEGNYISLYCGGLMLSEIEYYSVTKGTEKEDSELHRRTLDLYEWICQMHYRGGDGEGPVGDRLYFCDTVLNDEGEIVPRNQKAPMSAGSCSLFGNTAFAVISKRLYELTNEKGYLERAVDVANAIADSEYFNKDGVIWNDRDAWTDCAFIGFFAREILPLENVSEKACRIFLTTAASILDKCCYEGGYYGSDWHGGDRWVKNNLYGNPYILTNTATTSHMLMAACQSTNCPQIVYTESDSELIPCTHPVQRAPAYIDLDARRTEY